MEKTLRQRIMPAFFGPLLSSMGRSGATAKGRFLAYKLESVALLRWHDIAAVTSEKKIGAARMEPRQRNDPDRRAAGSYSSTGVAAARRGPATGGYAASPEPA